MKMNIGFPPMMLIIVVFIITLAKGKISIMDSAIANPSMLTLCEKPQSFIVAGGGVFQLFKKVQGKFTKQSYIISDAIIRIKCLKQGLVAVATKDKFCIIDMSSKTPQKCRGFKGRPLSIAEQLENNMTYLLISENYLEFNEIQTSNYGVGFTKNQLSLPQERNVVIASYLANRQFIFVANEISIYRSPFSSSSVTNTQLEDFEQIKEIKGLGSLKSALITDWNGNFMLLKGQEQVGTWTDTPYERGCLCTKEQFVLANKKKLALYDFQVVKIYDGYTLSDLVDVACVSDGETHHIYLLDGNGKVVTVEIEPDEGSAFIYIIIVAFIIIVILVAKFVWFPSRQAKSALSSDLDDASKQDRQNAYRELKDLNVKDTIKESK